MAKTSPNLKVNVSSDTSGFTKGMGQAKKELKTFETTSNDALSKLASLFGVNTAQMQKFQDAAAGAGRKLEQMGGEGNKALGQIVTAAGKAGAAIGAIGIGAAVTAFKLLNEEATAFKNTVAGANIELQTQAYLSTYRQAMHDYQSATGQTMAEAESQWQKFWGRLWQNTKSTITTAITSPVFSGGSTALASTLTNAINETAKAAEYANDVATKSEGIAGRIFELQVQQTNATRRWADMEKEISEQRLIAYDQEASAAERSAALARMRELINTKYTEQAQIQEQISKLTDEDNGLVESGLPAIEAANQLYVQSQNTLAQMNNELKSLERLSKSIANSAASEAEARRKTAEAIAKGVQRMQEFATAQIEMAVSPESAEALSNKISEAMATKPVEVPLRMPVEQVERQLLDLNDVIQQTMVDGIEGIAESLGNLLGNLTNGEGGVADFGQDLLEMFGGFAQKFGKVLVAFGVAVEAAKVSAESFNGIAAIAAGAALIAAGAAVKTIASNMASAMGGASSAGSYVASSASYGSSGYANSTLQVEVSGTLTANGSQLVAVLNNENNRKYYTS